MNGIIKWGIIGLGNVAHEFAKSFYNIKNAKLIAIASKTPNKLSKFKDEFNAAGAGQLRDLAHPGVG